MCCVHRYRLRRFDITYTSEYRPAQKLNWLVCFFVRLMLVVCMYVRMHACIYVCMCVYGKDETEDLQFEASVFCDKALLILTPVYSFFQRI
jgi:hypothetical protein